MPTPAGAGPGPSVSRRAGRGDGLFFYFAVPGTVRTEIEGLTAAVTRDRRLQGTGPRRRVPPVIGLPVVTAAGVALIVTAYPAAVTVGIVFLVAVVVLGFVPVRRWRRRTHLRRLSRRWADHRLDRSAVGARWRPALDALTDTNRQLRALGLFDLAAQTATALDQALTRAVTGTRLDAEISAATAAIGGFPSGAEVSPTSGDPDVDALRADLTRAGVTAARLLKANTAAAHHSIGVADAVTAERGRGAAAVEAVRVRALGTLAQATTDAAVLLPDPTAPAGDHLSGS